MDEATNPKQIWTRFILKLKSKSPFFANLAMFAEFDISDDLVWAETRGKRVGISAQILDDYSELELQGLLLHQVLHLALSHCFRGVGKNYELWNVAADIVVNNIIHDAFGWPAAPGTAWNFYFAGCSADKVYATLLRESEKSDDCISTDDTGTAECEALTGEDSAIDNSSNAVLDNPAQAESSDNLATQIAEKYKSTYDIVTASAHDKGLETEEYWRYSLVSAERSHQAGDISASLKREYKIASHHQIEWRMILWRFVSPTQDDYTEFDNRFLHRGLYLEVLQCESVLIDVVIDTSGSVSEFLLSAFLTELSSIKAHFPHVSINVFYCDAKLNGPFKLPSNYSDIPVPIGGGGTDFEPYFSQLKAADLLSVPLGVVYFTDGFAQFPRHIPAIDVLWVIPDYGVDEEAVPFGTVIRIKDK